MEVTLEERVAALERKLSASEAEEEPAGYYTSKYSGEEIDALLDKSAGGGTSPRRNILDNWYFVGGGTANHFPINQRGKTNYDGSGPIFDRWRLSGSGTAALNVDGVVLTAISSNLEFYQYLAVEYSDIAGKSICISAIVDGKLFSAETIVPDTAPTDWTNMINIVTSFGFIQANYEGNASNHVVFSVIATTGKAIQLVAAKYEIGTTQTLAYQDEADNWKLLETPDYAEELAECQRYFVQFRSEGQRFIGIAHLDSASYGQCVIWTPVQMRAIPTVSGAVAFYGGGNNGMVTSAVPVGVGATAVRVNITLQDAVSTNSIVFLHSNDIQGDPVTLSAEL